MVDTLLALARDRLHSPARLVLVHVGCCSVAGLILLAHAPQVRAQSSKAPRKEAGVQTVIRAIRDGEWLFRNIDMTYEENYELLNMDKLVHPSNSVMFQTSLVHLVLQEGRLLYKEEQKGEARKWIRKGELKRYPFERSTLIAFDGAMLRSVRVQDIDGERGGYANLITGGTREPWRLVPYMHPPHAIGSSIMEHSLADTLEGRLLTDYLRTCRLEGEETVEGIRCIKILEETRPKNPDKPRPPARCYYWLAVDHAYLPVRQTIHNGLQDKQPDLIIQTGDWREAEAGIEVPFRAVRTGYQQAKTGEFLPSHQTTIKVQSLSLRPKHELAYFQDVPIPPGLPVYEEKDGVTVAKYLQPGRVAPGAAAGAWSFARWFLLLAGLLLLGLGGWFVYRRVASPKVMTSSPLNKVFGAGWTQQVKLPELGRLGTVGGEASAAVARSATSRLPKGRRKSANGLAAPSACPCQTASA